MESTIQLIKRKAISLIEQQITKTGTVLAVREWAPATIVEVDLHLPGVHMQKWTQAQHIKCKVGAWEYRDYTPCGWDADTATCTLIIHTGHDGAGARWAHSLRPGDVFSYVGIGGAGQRPAEDAHLVFLGDESAIGHFYALQQLAMRAWSTKGAIAFATGDHLGSFSEYFSDFGAMEAVGKSSHNDSSGLLQWAMGQHFQRNTVFYVAGNIPVVMQLRTWLKAQGFSGAQIRAQGFWK